MALRVQKLAIPALLTPVIFASAMFALATTYSTPAYPAYTPAYCQDYARRASRGYSRGGAVGGAVRGGVGGAAVGAVVGGNAAMHQKPNCGDWQRALHPSQSLVD